MSETVDGPKTSVRLLKSGVSAADVTGMPEEIPCAGLSKERTEYLYSNIRQYVRDPYKDSVAPAVDDAEEWSQQSL